MRILLVDDHVDSLKILAKLLRQRGHTVETSGTLAKAVSACASGGFQLVVCDIGLPDGSGWEIAPVARASGAKAIALSGFGMAEDVHHSEIAGFAAHLTKPISFQEIESAIATACEPSASAVH